MYDNQNVFAKIIRGEIPATKLYEDEHLIAIKDIYPVAPIHILVIPKGQYRNFDEFSQKATAAQMHHYFKKISDIAKEQGAEEYRIVSNNGPSVGQSVFHFHTHIISGSQFSKLI
jgi:histidine triad (HIT) family protein